MLLKMNNLTLCGERNAVITMDVIRVFLLLLQLDLDYFMRDAGSPLGVIRVFWNLVEVMPAHIVNVLNTSELYTLK